VDIPGDDYITAVSYESIQTENATARDNNGKQQRTHTHSWHSYRGAGAVVRQRLLQVVLAKM
jgi:hypothetical protein